MGPGAREDLGHRHQPDRRPVDEVDVAVAVEEDSHRAGRHGSAWLTNILRGLGWAARTTASTTSRCLPDRPWWSPTGCPSAATTTCTASRTRLVPTLGWWADSTSTVVTPRPRASSTRASSSCSRAVPRAVSVPAQTPSNRAARSTTSRSSRPREGRCVERGSPGAIGRTSTEPPRLRVTWGARMPCTTGALGAGPPLPARSSVGASGDRAARCCSCASGAGPRGPARWRPTHSGSGPVSCSALR